MLLTFLILSLVHCVATTPPILSFPIDGQPPLQFYESDDVCQVLDSYCNSLPGVDPIGCVTQIHIELVRQFTRAWESIVTQLKIGPEFFIDCKPLNLDVTSVLLFNSDFIPDYVPPDHFTTRNSTRVVENLLDLLRRAMKRDTQVLKIATLTYPSNAMELH